MFQLIFLPILLECDSQNAPPYHPPAGLLPPGLPPTGPPPPPGQPPLYSGLPPSDAASSLPPPAYPGPGRNELNLGGGNCAPPTYMGRVLSSAKEPGSGGPAPPSSLLPLGMPPPLLPSGMPPPLLPPGMPPPLQPSYNDMPPRSQPPQPHLPLLGNMPPPGPVFGCEQGPDYGASHSWNSISQPHQATLDDELPDWMPHTTPNGQNRMLPSSLDRSRFSTSHSLQATSPSSFPNNAMHSVPSQQLQPAVLGTGGNQLTPASNNCGMLLTKEDSWQRRDDRRSSSSGNANLPDWLYR